MLSLTRHLIPTLALAVTMAISSAGWAEEKEEKITADQLPAAVKATLEKAAKGAVLSEFERETEKGKTVYTAEIPGAEKGTVIEFTVAEDGTLLKQETEKDSDHEDGDKKGEDKDGDKKHEHKDKK